MVAQAIDHERLSRWLQTLAVGSEGQQVASRQTNNNAPVLAPFPVPSGEVPASDQTTNFVASLIADIATLYEMPHRTGDWISIDGAYGEVKSINMRNVEITTPDDTVVVIPHLKLWNASIFNANDGSQNLQCVADFYLHPCS
jgi:hypothetical protein